MLVRCLLLVAMAVLSCATDLIAGGGDTGVFFNGHSTWISVGDFPSLATNFTIEMWLQSPCSVEEFLQTTYVSKADQVGTRLFEFGIETDHERILTTNGLHGNFPRVNDTAHKAIVVEQVGDVTRLRLFINGSMVEEMYTDHLVDTSVGGNWILGSATRRAKGGMQRQREYCGFMDEVRFWDYGRGETEIASDMHVSLTGSEEGLVAYFPFSEGTGLLTYSKTDVPPAQLGGLLRVESPTWTPSTFPVVGSFVSLPTTKDGLNQTINLTPLFPAALVKVTTLPTVGRLLFPNGTLIVSVPLLVDPPLLQYFAPYGAYGFGMDQFCYTLCEVSAPYDCAQQERVMINRELNLPPVAGHAHAVNLNGEKAYVELDDFQLSDSFTLELWLDPSSGQGGQSFIAKHDLKSRNIFLFGFWHERYYVGIRGHWFSGGTPVHGPQHVALACDAQTPGTNCTLYVDGVKIWNEMYPGEYLGDTSGLPWVLGQEYDSGATPSDFLAGNIDDVRFWTVVRSQEEILSSMHMQLTGEEEGINRWITFDTLETRECVCERGDSACTKCGGRVPRRIQFPVYGPNRSVIARAEGKGSATYVPSTTDKVGSPIEVSVIVGERQLVCLDWTDLDDSASTITLNLTTEPVYGLRSELDEQGCFFYIAPKEPVFERLTFSVRDLHGAASKDGLVYITVDLAGPRISSYVKYIVEDDTTQPDDSYWLFIEFDQETARPLITVEDFDLYFNLHPEATIESVSWFSGKKLQFKPVNESDFIVGVSTVAVSGVINAREGGRIPVQSQSPVLEMQDSTEPAVVLEPIKMRLALVVVLVMLSLALVFLCAGCGFVIRGRIRERRKAKRELDIQMKLLEDAEEEKRRARIELAVAEEADKAKSMFLARMSHEIRSPLSAIIGLTELLVHSTSPSNTQMEYLKILEQCSRAQLELLNNILDFTKMQAGRMCFEPGPFCPRMMVRQVIKTLSAKAELNGVYLGLCVHGSTPVCNGDRLRIKQVLTNLVDNAIKFSEGSPVVVSVGAADVIAAEFPGIDFKLPEDSSRTVLLVVKDGGIGLANESKSRIFIEFEQNDSSTTRRYGGSGLGLAIAKNIVEGMGGVIGVDSEEGCGSIFWFHLPILETPASKPAQLHRGVALLVTGGAPTVKCPERWDGKTPLGASQAAALAAEGLTLIEVDNEMDIMTNWQPKWAEGHVVLMWPAELFFDTEDHETEPSEVEEDTDEEGIRMENGKISENSWSETSSFILEDSGEASTVQAPAATSSSIVLSGSRKFNNSWPSHVRTSEGASSSSKKSLHGLSLKSFSNSANPCFMRKSLTSLLIWIDSVQVTLHLTVLFPTLLPCMPSQQDAMRKVGARRLVLPLMHEGILSTFDQSNPTSPTEATVPVLHVHGVSVLVADDSDTNARIVMDMLAVEGCKVTRVADGLEATQAAASNFYDLILMDINMPVMDGLTATRVIREKEELKGLRPVPIFALSANTISVTKDRCEAAGMMGYLTKPLTRRQLRQVLQEISGRRGEWEMRRDAFS